MGVQVLVCYGCYSVIIVDPLWVLFYCGVGQFRLLVYIIAKYYNLVKYKITMQLRCSLYLVHIVMLMSLLANKFCFKTIAGVQNKPPLSPAMVISFIFIFCRSTVISFTLIWLA